MFGLRSVSILFKRVVLRLLLPEIMLEEMIMAGLELGSVAPHFTLDDCDGNTVSLSDLEGKKVLLYFFTSPGGGN